MTTRMRGNERLLQIRCRNFEHRQQRLSLSANASVNVVDVLKNKNDMKSE